MKNKKFMSRLLSAALAGAMVLSMAPAAFAGTPNETEYVDNYDGTHASVHYDANGDIEWTSNSNHSYVYDGTVYVGEESGVNCICGAEKPAEPVEPECLHATQICVDDENGSTHHAVCEECNETVSENIPHSYVYDGTVYVGEESGVNCICGAKEATCDHMGNHWKYENKGETHDVICVDCGKTVTPNMAHYFIDGECICGAKKAEDAELKIIAINFYSEDEEKQIAEVPAEVAADATYINTSILTAPKGYEIAIVGDLPIRDGYVYVVVRKAQSTCDHMANDWSYVNNQDGTHNVVCNACEEVVTENIAHYFIDGKCICGAEEVVCDHMGNHWSYTDNGNGTHKVICADCGETVTEEAECNYESGKCVCGSEKTEEKPVEPSEPGDETPSAPSTSKVNLFGTLLEGAGLVSFFRILFKALFHI